MESRFSLGQGQMVQTKRLVGQRGLLQGREEDIPQKDIDECQRYGDGGKALLHMKSKLHTLNCANAMVV